MRSIMAVLWLLFITSTADAGDWTQISDSLRFRECTVTDEHRYDEAHMSGHWGHHLSHLIRTRTTGLWYVDDSGNDVMRTRNARYYQLVSDTTWIMRANIYSWGHIQQNTASLACGDTIYTYGVDIYGHGITENIVDTRTMTRRTGTIITIGSDTNYIGAVVSPSETRVVWWAKVVNGGPCEWNYTYNDGTGWSPVIKTLIPDYTDFSYVVATFVNDSTLWVAGEALGGGGGDPWTYALGSGRVMIGQPMDEFTILPGDNYTAADIWFNHRSGYLHVLGDGKGNELTYFNRTLGGEWPTIAETLSVSGGAYRASRFIDTPDDNLYLVLSTPSGLRLKQLNKNTFRSKADIDSARTFDIHASTGFSNTHAIFPERPEHQTTPVGAMNLVYPGNDYEFARYLKHLEIRRDWPTAAEAIPTPQSSSLSPNIPNPFNPSTAIRFTVARTGFVTITIHDLTGRTVAVLVARSLPAGNHGVIWNARDSRGRMLGSGMYICRMSGPDGTSVRRITLAR
jgi:hypothetical protein